jgi:hypothetical protein
MVGVWIEPVTAQVMMTFFCGAAMGLLLNAALRVIYHSARAGRSGLSLRLRSAGAPAAR